MHIQPAWLLLKALNALRPCLCHRCSKKLSRSGIRLPVVVAALLAVVSLGTVTLGASLMEKYRTAEELDSAMETAGEAQSAGRGLPYEKSQAEQRLVEATALLEDAEQHKAQARRKLVAVMRESENLRRTYDIDASNTGAVLALVDGERERIVSFLGYLRARTFLVAANGPDFGVTLVRNLLHTSLGEMTDIGIRSQALERARIRVFAVALRALELGEQLPAFTEEYHQELEAYQKAWDAYLEARGAVADAEERIAEVARITEEVQAEIRKLQRELARIDAKLVARLERELIEKGLMDPQPGERSDGRIRSKQTFRWPVVGKISAGYLNAAYKAFFGVPHRGIDIVVPQGTAVGAAADGIVFLARDGGRFGYSYVLIGHRSGYATLYGHLSSIAVAAGQEVAAGDLVGSSGGTPGSHGAGPMTTGAHFHFEVILNGEHVDPLTILP